MGGRLALVLMGIALAVIGGGIFLMNKAGSNPSPAILGAETPGSTETAQRGKYADAPLTPTGGFNVSERLESGINLIPVAAEVAEQLHDPESEPLEDLFIIEELIGYHLRMFDSVPGGGENADIMRHMTGGNERRVALISPDHPAINESGELVDRWGTPFHFHQLSRRKLDVRSAGPDKELWSEDDVIIEGEDDEGGFEG